MNKLFRKREELKPEEIPAETPAVVETPKVAQTPAPAPKVVETPKVVQTPKVAAPAISIKEKVKEGEKWLKHIEGSANHLLYTINKKNPKTGLDEKVTVCTEVDCEKNRS
jgi:hypothetical protein